MKRPSTSGLLRAAAVVSVLYCGGHMAGYPWTPGVGADAEAVVRQMHGVSFDAVGVQRTYWDFYFGFGLIVGAFLLAQAAWLWSLAAVARRDARLAVPGARVTLCGAIVNAYLSHRFFSAPPMVLSLLVGVLVAASVWAARAESSDAHALHENLTRA